MLNVNNHVKLVGPRIVSSVLVHDKSFSKQNFASDILWKTKWVNQNFVITGEISLENEI